jgi:hypothetical protein
MSIEKFKIAKQNTVNLYCTCNERQRLKINYTPSFHDEQVGLYYMCFYFSIFVSQLGPVIS